MRAVSSRIQLRIVDNRCYQYGLDLSGGAIRAYAMYQGIPTYITNDTFRGNTCSNGGALGGLHANFDVINSLMIGNKAIGWGGNPRPPAHREVAVAVQSAPTALRLTCSSTTPSSATTGPARGASHFLHGPLPPRNSDDRILDLAP